MDSASSESLKWFGSLESLEFFPVAPPNPTAKNKTTSVDDAC